jgi:hypothetical protein
MPFPAQFKTARRPVGRKKKLASFETSLIGCRKTTYRRIARNRQVQNSCHGTNRRGCDLFATVSDMPPGVYVSVFFVAEYVVIADRAMARNGGILGRVRGNRHRQ